jgi:hypothetical protein
MAGTSRDTVSLALSCNVYNDASALRGLLELGSSYFDNIFIIHSGPGGAYSNDGTIELCQSFGIQPIFADMNAGFGAIRTRLIHECGCEWAMIMDADERFFPQLPTMLCEGIDRYPAQPEPTLRVTKKQDIINQGAHVKNQIKNPELMALRFTRRHWFDFTMTRPTENWIRVWDHQLRCVRNVKEIHYTLAMHEALVDDRTGKTPKFLEQDPIGGPFYEHFHMFYRRTQPGHKEHNEQQYSRLSRGEKMEVRDPQKRLFAVMTFGAASCLVQGVFEMPAEAEKAAEEIRTVGGEPKIYECYQK